MIASRTPAASFVSRTPEDNQIVVIETMQATTKDKISNAELKMKELSEAKGEITILVMLLQQNTKQNCMKLTFVNAEMHKVGERLKQLCRMRD